MVNGKVLHAYMPACMQRPDYYNMIVYRDSNTKNLVECRDCPNMTHLLIMKVEQTLLKQKSSQELYRYTLLKVCTGIRASSYKDIAINNIFQENSIPRILANIRYNLYEDGCPGWFLYQPIQAQCLDSCDDVLDQQ